MNTPKYILFIMDNGDKISVDAPQAMRILQSQQQQLMVQENGQWTGYTINKAHLIDTKPDFDRMRSEAEMEARNSLKLNAPEMTEEQRKESLRKWEEMKKELKKKLRWIR